MYPSWTASVSITGPLEHRLDIGLYGKDDFRGEEQLLDIFPDLDHKAKLGQRPRKANRPTPAHQRGRELV